MPYSKFRRVHRTIRKRRVMRRRRAIPFAKVSRAPKLRSVGQTKFAKLTYTQILSGTAASGSYINNAFRLNSLYDPDATGAGGQPYLFDQLAAIWSRYRVMGCKVTIHGKLTQASTEPAVFFMKSFPAGFSPSLNLAELLQQKRNVSRFIDNTRTWTISRYFDVPTTEGITHRQYMADQDFQAGIGASPTRSPQVYVGFIHPDGTTSVTGTFMVSLTYYALFSCLKNPGTS